MTDFVYWFLCSTVVVFATFFIAANAVSYTLKGNFNETKQDRPHSYILGQFYYLYDDSNASNCRLRFDYNLNGVIVTNVYNYEHNSLYSMNNNDCNATRIVHNPDPWWVFSNYSVTSVEEDGLFWYDRVIPANFSRKTIQVESILVSNHESPELSGYQLKAIKFIDGRFLRFSGIEVNSLASTDPIFSDDISAECLPPNCSTFSDIVFIMEEAGSIKSSEFGACKRLISSIAESFEFGEDSVSASLILFATSARLTVEATNNKTNFISRVKNMVQRGGGCYLGKALELAMSVFDNSTRSKNGVIPNRFIIITTDGQDYGYSSINQNSQKLKNDYNATLIFAPIGASSSYITKLESFATVFNGEPAAFPFKNDSAIQPISDPIVDIICDECHDPCGTQCKGFCGCGQCLCPTCESTGDKCNDYKCSVNGECKFHENPKPEGNKCFKYDCDEVYNEEWTWVRKPSDINSQCRSDDCTNRICDNMTGCIETDICNNENETNWVVEVDMDLTIFNSTEFLISLSNISGIDLIDLEIETVMDKSGQVLRVILHVNDRDIAQVIIEAMLNCSQTSRREVNNSNIFCDETLSIIRMVRMKPREVLFFSKAHNVYDGIIISVIISFIFIFFFI